MIRYISEDLIDAEIDVIMEERGPRKDYTIYIMDYYDMKKFSPLLFSSLFVEEVNKDRHIVKDMPIYLL